MNIGRVIGTVTSTLKHPAYLDKKLLLVKHLAPDLTPLKNSVIAVDMVQAGIGDIVLVNKEGNATRQVLGRDAGPILELVLGIIDTVDLKTD
ncbi:MAG: EutN/CcmL family microcompartment protein [Spirochaetota bacterium]